MMKFIEEKVNNSILTLFTLGLIFLLFGILVIMYEALLRTMVGILFFLLAYVALHLAYKIQTIRQGVNEKLGSVGVGKKKSKK